LEEEGETDSSADQEDLRSINSAGRHLLSLVSDVLYMPKAEIDQVEVSVRPFDLDRCLEVVVATCMNLVSQNDNELVVDKQNTLGVIESDEMRLRQILINLLSNAGKFTRNGKVVLSASRVAAPEGEEIVISVRDNGIGIPKAALQSLFAAFNHASVATSRSYGGSGLGLAVSHDLIRLLNGDLCVESEPGIGSVFTIRLPVAAASASLAA
jgi:signal transduction histidine kinase